MRSRLFAAVALLLGCTAGVAAQTAPAGVVEYYHVDALGSVRAVTSATGAVVRTHHYHPFGEGVESGADPMRFTGKPRDGETGLDYFGARYYASRTGRFTTVDPGHVGGNIFDPQSWNGYAYARNNPLRFVDPTGTDYRVNVFGGKSFWVPNDTELGRLQEGGFLFRGGNIFNAAGTWVGTYEYFDPFARFALQTGMLADRWLKESLKDMAVGTAFAAGGGLVAGAVGGGLVTSEVLGIGRIGVTVRPSSGQIAQMQQVLARQGRAGVEKALRSLERRLAEHLSKIDAARAVGGNTSSMEREVANFRQLIAAARQILGK